MSSGIRLQLKLLRHMIDNSIDSSAESDPYPRAQLKLDLTMESPDWQQSDVDFHDKLAEVIKLTLKHINYFKFFDQAEVSMLLTDNEHIRQLKGEYLGIDASTNVLSFPNYETSPTNFMQDISKQDPFLGDIALSYEKIAQEALEENKTFLAHLTHLVVHSVLHLIGYDHIKDDEAEQMEALEVEILAQRFNIANPYVNHGNKVFDDEFCDDELEIKIDDYK
jgi:probable rRNA maturation factor